MKILIVDDHSYNRDLLSFILNDEGYDCIEAENGLNACEIFADDINIDVILMDVNMPKMDGLTATQKIKSDHPERFVPILFVTALDDSEMVTKCLASGGDDFIPKPVNEDVLLAKINAHVRSQKLYNNLKEANEKLNYHRQLINREHAIVERVFNNRDRRIKSRCTNIVSYTSPMSMFDGDMVLEAPSPTGGVYFLVGDFTGHGLAAAIGSLPVTEIFYSFASRRASVAQLAQEINSRLYELLPENMFFCAAIGELDYLGKELTMWVGGMNDILSLNPGDKTLARFFSAHMPLGILDEKEFDNSPQVVPLSAGSRTYIYTDGVNEAANLEGEEFGLARLEDILLCDGENQVQTIVDAVRQFHQGAEQSDDMSILELTAGRVSHCDKLTSEAVDVGSEYHSVESFPWQLQMHLVDDDLRSTSIVDQVMAVIASLKGIELHQDKIFTIVSELYNNALEHGVLRLSSSLKNTPDGFETYYRLREQRLAEVNGQRIDINMSYIKGTPNQVHIELTDSGDGFDIAALSVDGDALDDACHGRGLALLYSLCSRLEYSQNGSRVLAVYDFCLH